MIVSTQNLSEGYEIVGCFTGSYSDGLHAGKDFLANIKEKLGGRIRSYDKKIVAVIDAAIEDMMKRAGAAGCDAVMGIRHQLCMGTLNKGMAVFVSVIGTGVRLKIKDPNLCDDTESEDSGPSLKKMVTQKPIGHLLGKDTSEPLLRVGGMSGEQKKSNV